MTGCRCSGRRRENPRSEKQHNESGALTGGLGGSVGGRDRFIGEEEINEIRN